MFGLCKLSRCASRRRRLRQGVITENVIGQRTVMLGRCFTREWIHGVFHKAGHSLILYESHQSAFAQLVKNPWQTFGAKANNRCAPLSLAQRGDDPTSSSGAERMEEFWCAQNIHSLRVKTFSKPPHWHLWGLLVQVFWWLNIPVHVEGPQLGALQ